MKFSYCFHAVQSKGILLKFLFGMESNHFDDVVFFHTDVPVPLTGQLEKREDKIVRVKRKCAFKIQIPLRAILFFF